jgi:Fe-S cluster assembly ATP-binding protein
MIEIKNLDVSVEGTEVLKNFSLKIEPGTVHAIMGPNGSGKSTLSKVIAGHPDYEVTSGSIEFEKDFNKIDLLELEPHERSLNGVYLANQYPVEVPGINNLDFLRESFNNHCKFQGAEEVTDSAFEQMALEKIKEVSLSPQFLYRGLNEGFSGGEKKRNEILQMLLLNPSFAIFDETDSGLDIDSLKVVTDCLNREKSSEKSFLLITHYKRILDFINPDYIHILKDGKIVKTGGIELADELEEKGYDWL